MTWWLTLAAALIIAAGLYFIRQRLTERTSLPHSVPLPRSEFSSSDSSAQALSQSEPSLIPFKTDATVQLFGALYTFAFSVPRFDYQILGPHLQVLNAVEAALPTAIQQQNYFPRRPALLPKLLRAINANDSTREEIVRLILQDAVLAGNVLKRANSAYYRQGNPVIESVDRAVVVLGSEGLRVPVATAVMQPVFQLPRGFFDQFAPVTWEWAQRSAVAAEAYARLHRVGDAFVAHLLGLLGGLGHVVLLRLTLDKYRGHNVMPRAEVFIRLMSEHSLSVTRRVAEVWELSPSFLAAIDAQIEQRLPQQMEPLARTLYFANLCGALAVLHRRDKRTSEQSLALLREQGLSAEDLEAMWNAALQSE